MLFSDARTTIRKKLEFEPKLELFNVHYGMVDYVYIHLFRKQIFITQIAHY